VNDRLCQSAVLWSEGCFAGSLRLGCLSFLVALALLALPPAHCQEAETAVAPRIPLGTDTAAVVGTGVIRTHPDRRPPEQEIAVTGMIPYGDYRMFSATVRCNAWTVGVEYDRHSLGHFLGSRVDYVAEVIPFVLLSEPAKADYWGNPRSPYQQHLYGLSILPVGFRMLWRGNKPLKLYISTKLGAIAFNQKALSLNASYVNVNLQSDFGIQVRLSDRVDLRVIPFQFFHVSNAYLAASNPGMDELAVKIGVSYHLGGKGSR
jgi:Lipid A 3-O-deacylase (PagL)